MKIVSWILAILAIVAAGLAAYSLYLYRAPSVERETVVFIERGTGARTMLAQLHAQNVLPAPWKIMLPVALSGDYRRFKAGEYHFAPGQSPRQVIASIVRGAVVVHAITIPEGLSVAQVRTVLLKQPLLSGELPTDIPEGSLATDTVHFVRGDTRASIIARLQEQQREILEEAWLDRAADLPLGSPHEALTLASIIEEETGEDEERRRVAAVYINRLRLTMPLQADPTVAYGIAPGGMTRLLTRADLKRDTPYNTYLHAGLPPGPISNPGKESIEAALNPLPTDELYFVATGNGGHWFAKTAKEHEQNVAKYRAIQRAKP